MPLRHYHGDGPGGGDAEPGGGDAGEGTVGAAGQQQPEAGQREDELRNSFQCHVNGCCRAGQVRRNAPPR